MARVSRSIFPEIETELAKLWGPAAEQIGGPELENPHVTRIVLANLVVECLGGHCESLGPVLETVIARFPCRAIVVRGSDDPERHLGAEVSALCHLPAPGLPQVCSERIVLRAGPEAMDLVPGAVRPLLEADLPHGPLVDRRPAYASAALSRPGRRMLAAGPRPARPGCRSRRTGLGLDPSLCRCSRDSAWFGLARWRELVAQFFDPPCHADRLKRIESVHIEALSPDADPTGPDGDLAGGLAGRSARLEAARPTRLIPPATRTSVLSARIGRPGRQRDPQDRHPADPGKLARSDPTGNGRDDNPDTAGNGGVPAKPAGAPTRRRSSSRPMPPDSCVLPRVIDAPELDPARRIAAALESSRARSAVSEGRPSP